MILAFAVADMTSVIFLPAESCSQDLQSNDWSYSEGLERLSTSHTSLLVHPLQPLTEHTHTHTNTNTHLKF